MPVRTLPPKSSLAQLKKQAKDLLKAHQSGYGEAIARLRASVLKLADASDAQIQDAKFGLLDAQRVIAREYGFDSWELLKAHVEQAGEEATIADKSAAGHIHHPPLPPDHEFFVAVGQLDLDRVRFLLELDRTLVNADVRGLASIGGDWGWGRPWGDPKPDDTCRAVHFAAYGNVELLRLLVEYGADVDALGYEGNHGMAPPLVLACWEGTLETVRLLLEAGANPNIPSIPGGSALHSAINHYDAEKIELLLQYGARHDIFSAAAVGDLDEVKRQLMPPDGDWLINRRDIVRDRSPIEWAVFHRQEGIAEFLLEAGAEVTPQVPISLGKLDQVRRLVETEADFVNRPLGAEGKGDPPLSCAVRGRQIAVVKYLLSAGADPNGRGWWGQHPFSDTEDGEIVQLLIEAGADVNVEHIRGRPMLANYLLGGKFDWAELLLQNGADIERRGTKRGGKTALQIMIGADKERARWGDYIPAMQFLLDRGADINTISDGGKTALSWRLR